MSKFGQNRGPKWGVYRLFIGRRQRPSFSLEMIPRSSFTSFLTKNRCSIDERGKNLEFFSNRSISENFSLEKGLLSTETNVFYNKNLIKTSKVVLGDSLELLIGVLSRIFLKSIDS